jgi:hypothetical protein
MTRLPASLPSSDRCNKQVEDAVARLIDLFALQAARELASEASQAKENTHAKKTD